MKQGLLTEGVAAKLPQGCHRGNSPNPFVFCCQVCHKIAKSGANRERRKSDREMASPFPKELIRSQANEPNITSMPSLGSDIKQISLNRLMRRH